MKTESTPRQGSFFDLASARHPDLKAPEHAREPQRGPARSGRFGPLTVVLSGALAGVAWLVIASRPEPLVNLLAGTTPAAGAALIAQTAQLPAAAQGGEALRPSLDLPLRKPGPAPGEHRGAASEPSTQDRAAVTASAPAISKRPRPGEPANPDAGVRSGTTPKIAAAHPPVAAQPVVVVAAAAEPVAFIPVRKISAPAPQYPDAARAAGEEGTVVVEAAVDATGAVTGTTIVRGRSPALDAAAAAAVSGWRFEPARRGSVAVESSYRVGIKFALLDPPAPPRADDTAEPATPLEVGGEIEPPRRLNAPLPAYPDAAWAAGVTGDVLVRAVIDERGEVADVEVLKGLPLGMTEAAVAAIRQWKFAPATRRGRPVAVYRHLSVRFEG